VQNDHEIYRSFFSLGGPLRFPLREDNCAAYSLHLGSYSELKGVFVGNRLAVLVDTESMMHILDAAVQNPFVGGYANYNKLMDELASYAVRQMINITVYAMTHVCADAFNYRCAFCTDSFNFSTTECGQAF